MGIVHSKLNERGLFKKKPPKICWTFKSSQKYTGLSKSAQKAFWALFLKAPKAPLRSIYQHLRSMVLKDLVQEYIGRIDLIHSPSTGNDDLARAEDAHRNPFALPLSLSCALALAKPLTRADARSVVLRVIEELGIDPLINGLLQHREEIIAFHQDPVQIVLLNIVTQRVVCINKAHIHLGHRRFLAFRLNKGAIKRLNEFQEPFHRLDCKRLTRDPRHLNPPIAKQLHIELLPTPTKWLPNNNRALIKEGLVRRLPIGKEILVTRSKDFSLMFKLENSCIIISNRDQVFLELMKQGIEINRQTPIGCHSHSRYTQRCDDERFRHRITLLTSLNSSQIFVERG